MPSISGIVYLLILCCCCLFVWRLEIGDDSDSKEGSGRKGATGFGVRKGNKEEDLN